MSYLIHSSFNDVATDTLTTRPNTYARRFSDTQIDGQGRLITVVNGVSQTEVDTILGLIDAEPFPDRVVSIEIGITSTRIRAYNEGGTEFTEYINCTQGSSSKALKNGAVSKIRQVVSPAHSSNTGTLQYLIGRQNYAVGDPVSFVPNYTYLADGTLRLDQYNSSGNFLAAPSQISFLSGYDPFGNFKQISKNKFRRFENLSSITITNNGLTNYSDLRSFTFTVLNSCSLIIFPVFRARQQSTGDQTRMRAAIRINGGAMIEATIISAASDQGPSFGFLGGVHDLLIREVSAGDSIEIIVRGATDGNGVLQGCGFWVLEDHTMVQA